MFWMPFIVGNGISVNLGVVTSESVNNSGQVTSAPIEGSKTVNDHFIVSQRTVSISGMVTERGSTIRNRLVRIFEAGALCRYTGKNIVSNCVITKFTPTESVENIDGFNYTITLAVVVISTPQTFTYGTTNVTQREISANINTPTNTGTQQPTTTREDATTTRRARASANVSSAPY